MLHPTMLDDVGPTCWLRLNRPLGRKEAYIYFVCFLATTNGNDKKYYTTILVDTVEMENVLN